MSTNDQQLKGVVSLNSMTQASLVVKALRSQKASRERYQDFNQNSLDVKSLNTAILNVKREQVDLATQKADMDNRIDSWTSSSIRPGDSIRQINEASNSRDDSEDEDNQQACQTKLPTTADDDFDFDDDPDDNRELFKGFVAPKSNRSGGGGSGLGKTSTTANNKFSSSTTATHQPSLITSKGIVIKPGQAIRVKARGNRAKSDMNAPLDY